MANQYKKGRWKDHNAEKTSKEAFDGKSAILMTWETRTSPYVTEVKEHDYIVGLKARIRSAENRHLVSKRERL